MAGPELFVITVFDCTWIIEKKIDNKSDEFGMSVHVELHDDNVF